MTKPTTREIALAQALALQGRCFQLFMECNKLRSSHSNTAVGLQFDAFAAEGLVCAHHPYLPPHFHCPPPSFFSQSLICANAADPLNKLTWFHGQVAPFPNAIPLGAALPSPNPDPNAPGTSAQRTAAARRRNTAAASNDRKRKRSTQSASNVPTAPTPYDTGFHSGASSGSDPEVNHVECIVAHHFNRAFLLPGAKTQLCYTIRWVGQELPSRQLYDHAAICRLHPSYWLAYARWGNGHTDFAQSFTKDGQSQRLKRYNSFYAKAWKEHAWAYENRDIPRPRSQELKPGGTILPPGVKPLDALRFPTESEQDP
jgi:hypothetical protein